jgi:ABC-2 type transport system permease protein
VSGQVFDLGYQRYEGERTSRWRRVTAIWRDGIRISLGLGRGAAAKIAPWLLIAFALIPVLVLIVIASFAASFGDDPADVDLPSYAEYYEFAIIPIALFAAIVAPLLVCSDRREGVLSLYAARPITAVDYVGARWAAFLTVSLAAAWVPDLLLFGWNTLEADDLGSFLSDDWDIVPRILLAGATVAVVFTTLALLTATFTTRRAYASVATLAVIFVGSAIGGIAENNFEGGISDVLSLLDVPQDVINAARWFFGEEVGDQYLSGWVYPVFLAAVTVGLGLLLLLRTRRLMRA